MASQSSAIILINLNFVLLQEILQGAHNFVTALLSLYLMSYV